MPRKLYGAAGLIIAAVLLIGTNMLANALFQGSRLDLTEGRLYTVTDGTRNILRSLDEPIRVRYYFSQKETSAEPFLSDHGRRVRELLQEYAQLSGGMIHLEIIDPLPFTEEEDDAVGAGIQGIPLRTGSYAYLGIEGVNSIDGRDVIPFLSPDREEFLEYDLTSMIYGLANPEQKTITILTGLPIDGAPADPMQQMMGQQGTNPWIIHQVLEQQYDVQVIRPAATSIPEDTDLLMVIHPKNINEQLKYAIDQYLMSGKNALIFVDPKSEADEPEADPNNPMSAMFAPRDSNLPEILASLGLELIEERVVADRTRAQQVMWGSERRPEVVPYVLYLNLREDDLNREMIPMANLRSITVGAGGALRKLDGAETTITPILQTTEDSQLIPAQDVIAFPDPTRLYNEFQPSGERYMIAASVEGRIRTAFPEGPEDGEKRDDHRDESEGPVNVLVVADTDLLVDHFWVQVQRLFGQSLVTPRADNGSMVANFVDYFSGSPDLIAIRGRGRAHRPFTRVEEIERRAREQFAAKEKEIAERLQETEQRLNQLQAARDDGNLAFLTDEQRLEIERFEEERLRLRRERRQVQADLRRDVEQLGTRLKFINIALIPAAVGVLAVGMGVFRHRRRRRS